MHMYPSYPHGCGRCGLTEPAIVVSGSGARRDSNKPWEKSLYIYNIHTVYIVTYAYLYTR